MSDSDQQNPQGARCLSCRYDLTGLSAESPCPECSMPIADSLQPAIFVHSNPSDRRNISASIRFLGLLFAAYPLLVLLGVAIGAESLVLIVPTAWMFSVVVMSGITRAGLIDPFGVYPKRLIVRCTVIAAIGPLPLLVFIASLFWFGYALSSVATMMCLLVPAQCAAALAFSRIAFIARDPESQRRNRQAVWIVLILGLLLAPLYIGPIIAGAVSFCAAWPLARTIDALPHEPPNAAPEQSADA